MLNSIYKKSPNFFQNWMVSIFNILVYRKRYGGNYENYLREYKKGRKLGLDELWSIQEKRFKNFIRSASESSTFYKELYKDTDLPESVDQIRRLPIVNKEQLRKNIDRVYTLKRSEGIVSKTGGTTGKSLEVIFTKDNRQEFFGFLDAFRSQFGYKLGERTAWFSGKDILTETDIRKNRFWKTDHLKSVRYYSTFHKKKSHLKYYIDDLLDFKPKFMVGFPSSMVEIARYGLKNDIDFPSNTVKAIFPTAETFTREIRADVETFFKTSAYDQYSSSEGAPLIFECENHNLHLELRSGVFEILDQNDNPTEKGRLIVTSFLTQGTPLIRYDIGDRVELSDKECICPNNNPVVKQILGRTDDYIYSPENGKVNLGNVSDTLKGIVGVIKFQIIQNSLSEIEINVVVDKDDYSPEVEKVFLQNWRNRVGNEMKINLKYVQRIDNESSGKYRLIKNHVKHLI
jgi:phenylacetate-CoA ligase